MIASTQITNTEIFSFITVLVFKLLSRKVLFINRNDNRNCLKIDYFLRKWQHSPVNYCKIINSWNTFETRKQSFSTFSNCFKVTLRLC